MRNPNVRVLVIALALAAAVAAAGMLLTRSDASIGVIRGADFSQSAQPAQAYLRVQVGGEVWPLIPLADGEHAADQPEKGAQNIFRTTPTSVVMHFSTCENQNCIQQGMVSLDNRSTRAMGGMIVCLPNQVVLELLSPEEAGMQ